MSGYVHDPEQLCPGRRNAWRCPHAKDNTVLSMEISSTVSINAAKPHHVLAVAVAVVGTSCSTNSRVITGQSIPFRYCTV